jgi:hypothetical protein
MEIPRRQKKAMKIEKVKSKRFRKVFRIILWLVVIFVVIRGIASMMRKDQTASLKTLIAANAKEQDVKRKGEFGTNSFAENFTRAFIEFNGDDEVYKENLAKYVSSEFKPNTNTARTAVLSVTAVKTDWIGENKVLVDCLVRFTTNLPAYNAQTSLPAYNAQASLPAYNAQASSKTTAVTPKPTPTAVESPTSTSGTKNNVEEMCLRVPISIKDDGKYIIESRPTFVANNLKSSQRDESQMDGTRVENEDIREITKTFLKSYCEDNSTSISYYMVDSSKIKGLDGVFTFRDIDTFELKKNGDKFNADVTYYVEGSAGRYIQEMQIVFVYKDNRYLIEKLNTVIK